MNICMVLADRDFPPDIRVEKEARSLISAGHRVFLLCPRTGDQPASETWNGIDIRRIAPLPFLRRKLNSLVFIPFFRDLQWKRTIRNLTRERNIGVVHVHDLPMVGTALGAAKNKGLPVIADLHENYPALVRLSFAYRKQRLAERLMWPARWERAEKRWGRRASHLFIVVDEMKGRLLEKGIPSENITVVGNTVAAEEFLSLPIEAKLTREFGGHFVIAYIGGFSSHRGLDTAIKAMPTILREMPNARLLLVGDGEMMPILKALTAEMRLNNAVLFTGWQPFERVPSYIAASTVCIVPHASTEQTEASGPHKLFQYMLMGKPVVVSSCRSLRRIIEETGAGVVFEAGDSDSFAQAVLKLKDTVLRTSLGDAGKNAVLNRYNWEKTAEKMLDVYRRTAAESRPNN